MVIDDPNIGAQRRNGVEPKLRQIWEIAGMCFKHRLTLVKISMLLLVTDFPSAYALSSWDCAGLTVELTNTCDDVGAYFHVCYGWNGELGTNNFIVPPMEGYQIHVQQYSTFNSSCGVIPPFTCPAAKGPLPLDHCD